MYRLAICLLMLTACASEYPSPYSTRPQQLTTEHGGGKGLWQPVPFTVAVGDSSAQAYIGSLRPFPTDPKPIAGVRPKEILSPAEIKAREAELDAVRLKSQARAW